MSEKKLVWERVFDEPFIKPKIGTVAPHAVTTPDIVIKGNKLDLYFGAVVDETERIIHMQLNGDILKENKPIDVSAVAHIVLEPGPAEFDNKHVFDPAVIEFNHYKHLYYSAIGNGIDKIGLAISKRNKSFTKLDYGLLNGRSPEAVVKDNYLYLFYVLNLDKKGYSIYFNSSRDGINFQKVIGELVLSPGLKGEWDEKEVTTPRIFELKGVYYMIYAGVNSNGISDVPTGFGLARSNNLYDWEKYPHNPVFSISDKGTWDDGALWFGTIFPYGKKIYLIYEGGQLRNVIGKTPALTQIGLAAIDRDKLLNILSDWN